MSTEYNKPLPQPQKWSQEFWKGTKDHKFLLKKCKECGHIDHPPYYYCTECMSLEHEWVEASGKGTVYTYSTTYMGAPPAFTKEQPFTLAMIDLAEGPRMLSRIVDAQPEEIKIGADVEAVFDDVTEDTTLIMFRLVK
jgi:hypothetical protein